MKSIIENLNKVFDNRVRLGIMSILVVNDWVDFTTIRSTLKITDGQLASNIKALEKAEYIEIRKQFIGNKPNTSYSVTQLGKVAFGQHLKALEDLLNLNG
ncbi:MAG: DNA-binding HxlR family transcriptional regulator [Saprospiraceae bacterium]|jgi:DNA-binding HxlR family transcriptional regulator